MNQDVVTRLVVGSSISVALGQPHAPAAVEGGSGLRLEGTGWVPAGVKDTSSAIPQVRKAFSRLVVLCRPWRRGLAGDLPLGVTAVVVLMVIAAMCAALFWPRAEVPLAAAPALPIAPLPQPEVPSVAVKMVPESYEAPLPEAGALEPAKVGTVEPNAGTLAPAPAPAPAPAAVPLPLPARLQPASVAPSAKPVPAPPAAPPAQRADKEASAEEKGPRSVVLDDAPQPKALAAQSAAAPSKPAALPHSAASGPAATPAEPSKSIGQRGTGLLAIAPDGRSAAFTNPKTRLPVQVKVGDQLPNGETVRSIDLKEGRVVTNAKEYSFE